MILNKIYDTTDKINDVKNYNINNYRIICNKLSKKNCNNNIFVILIMIHVKPTLNKSKLINHIIRLSNELLYNDLVYKEIMNIDEYYISDIIDKIIILKEIIK